MSAALRLAAVEDGVHDRAEQRRFEALYREHFAFVWRTARRLGIEAHALDDVSQEVFVVVARRLTDFEGRSSERTWLFSITHRVVQGYRRGLGRRKRKHAALADASKSRHNDPYPNADAARALLELVAQLPDRYRSAFILGELEGMTSVEVAEALDLKPSTAATHVRKARAKMASAVAKRQAHAQHGARQ